MLKSRKWQWLVRRETLLTEIFDQFFRPHMYRAFWFWWYLEEE